MAENIHMIFKYTFYSLNIPIMFRTALGRTINVVKDRADAEIGSSCTQMQGLHQGST